MKKTYSELLKDPRWQKKRLEILQRDNFRCQSCMENEKQLHVHHICNEEDLLPWEYKNTDLITLCEECHKTWHFTFGNKNLNEDIICLVVKLYNRLFEEEVERAIKKGENGL